MIKNFENLFYRTSTMLKKSIIRGSKFKNLPAAKAER